MKEENVSSLLKNGCPMSLELFLKQIGRNVAQARKALDITQKIAASNLGISYRYYQSIESGDANITLTTLYRLSQVFKIEAALLLKSPNS